MRLLLISVSSIILFFPAFWLFSKAVGDNWGAGIAAFFMYIWYPFMAMKFLDRNDTKTSGDMDLALASGDLEVCDYEVFSFVKIDDEDTGFPFYLLDIGQEKTLCLCGDYLHPVIEGPLFPRSIIRVFWNKSSNFTYGIQSSGDKLFPEKVLPASERLLESEILPNDREILAVNLRTASDRLMEYGQLSGSEH